MRKALFFMLIFACRENQVFTADVIQELYTSHTANIYRANEEIIVKTELHNSTKQELHLTIAYTVYDYFKQKVKSGRVQTVIIAESRLKKEFSAGRLLCGFYFYEIKIMQELKQIDRKIMGIAVLPSPNKNINRHFIGMSAFGFPADTIEVAGKMGIHIAGVGLHWNALEPFHGKYNQTEWDKVAQRIEALKQQGIKPEGYIGLVPNSWWVKGRDHWQVTKDIEKDGYRGFSEQAFGSFGRFIKDVVKRFGADIKTWTFSCETDQILMHYPSAKKNFLQDFARMSVIGNKAIKSVQPNAFVTSYGVSDVDVWKGFPVGSKVWKYCNAIHDSFNFSGYPAGIHNNTKSYPENYLPVVFSNVKKLVGKNKKFTIGESGWLMDLNRPFMSDYYRDFGRSVSAGFLMAAAEPQLSFWDFYVMSTGHWKKKRGFTMLGKLGSHYNPFPAVATLATVSRFVSDATKVARLPFHNDIYCYVFEKPVGSLAVIWSMTKEIVKLELDDVSIFTAYRLDGSLARLTRKCPLTKYPLYLISPKLSYSSLKALLEKARFNVQPVKIGLYISHMRHLQVYVINQSPVLVKGRMTISSSQLQITSKPQEYLALPDSTQILNFRAQPPKALANHTQLQLRLHYTNDIKKNEFTLNKTTICHPVRKLSRSPRIDGNLEEYQHIPSLTLNTTKNVFPNFAEIFALWGGRENFSIQVKVAYDQDNFYFVAVVHDKKHIQEYDSSCLYKHDCFEISFDMQNDAKIQSLKGQVGYDGKNDYDFGLALGPKGPLVWQWVAGAAKGTGRFGRSRFAARRDEKQATTYYEWAIPWKELQPFDVKPGAVFGFNFSAVNSNNPNSFNPYWLGLTEGTLGGKAPELYHNFVLE